MVPGPRDIAPLPAECFWGGWAPPDMRHCEDNLCGFIAAPADTWSNLAYLLVGLWLWRGARSQPGASRLFGPVAVFVGLASFLFHTSFTAFFQFFDFVAMFLLAALILTIDLERVGWMRPSRAPAFLAGFTAASSAAFLLCRRLGLPVQPIMIAEGGAIIALELALVRLRTADYRPLWAALGLLAIAVVFWVADYGRWLCDPADHVLQGHAAWHLFSAAAMAAGQRFYRQFARAAAPSAAAA